MENQLKMLIRKNLQLENKIGVSKKENDRLLDVVKTHRHEADLSQKEACCLVFKNSRFKSFVYDKEKKLTKDLEACEVKFAKMKERFVKTSNQVTQMRIKNDAIKLDMGVKKAEAELKR